MPFLAHKLIEQVENYHNAVIEAEGELRKLDDIIKSLDLSIQAKWRRGPHCDHEREVLEKEIEEAENKRATEEKNFNKILDSINLEYFTKIKELLEHSLKTPTPDESFIDLQAIYPINWSIGFFLHGNLLPANLSSINLREWCFTPKPLEWLMTLNFKDADKIKTLIQLVPEEAFQSQFKGFDEAHFHLTGLNSLKGFNPLHIAVICDNQAAVQALAERIKDKNIITRSLEHIFKRRIGRDIEQINVVELATPTMQTLLKKYHVDATLMEDSATIANIRVLDTEEKKSPSRESTSSYFSNSYPTHFSPTHHSRRNFPEPRPLGALSSIKKSCAW